MSNYKNYRLIAEQITLGIIDGACKFLLGVVIIAGIWNYVMPIDDCDKSRWDRCGLKVIKDQKTGKEYLLSPGGQIIKRNEDL